MALLSSSVAAAPADRDKARAKLVEGVKLLEADKPAQALARFEEAYAIVPSPKIQYNMALAYRRLDRSADAYKAFERFLREGTEESAQHLSHARQELDRLSKRVAFVELASDVSGAEVLLDGRRVGVTPLPGRLPVDTGPHEFLVRSPALGDQSRRFTAAAGEPVTLRIEFRPAVAPLPVPQQAVPPREATRLADSAQDRGFIPQPRTSPEERDGNPGPTDRKTSWPRFAGYGLLAAGLAGAAGGGYLLLRDDGCGDRLPGFMCNTAARSRVPGWILLGAGAGLALGGGILLYATRDVQVAITVSPGAISLKGSL